MMATIEIVVREPTPEELEIAELNRAATRHKSSGDWQAAITCLRRAREIELAHGIARDVETALRLPMFLQQGGHFDAAMVEFERLLSEADVIAAYGLEHQPDFFRVGHAHRVRAMIYDKMRLACKRAKRGDLADKYAVLWEKHGDEFDRYRRMMDLHRARESKKRDAKLQAMRLAWKQK